MLEGFSLYDIAMHGVEKTLIKLLTLTGHLGREFANVIATRRRAGAPENDYSVFATTVDLRSASVNGIPIRYTFSEHGIYDFVRARTDKSNSTADSNGPLGLAQLKVLTRVCCGSLVFVNHVQMKPTVSNCSLAATLEHAVLSSVGADQFDTNSTWQWQEMPVSLADITRGAGHFTLTGSAHVDKIVLARM